jgi:cation:H+ antiporter
MEYLIAHINLVYVVCGLGMLVSGGELLVRGGVALAEKLKIPKLIIGLTIIGFGTSMPELL